MKVNKLILGMFIILLSVNFVFAASVCRDTDTKQYEAKDYTVKGSIYFDNKLVFTDSCVKGSKTMLTEGYCSGVDNPKWATETFDCKKIGRGCSNGACVPMREVTGLATLDSSTGTYLGIAVVVIIIVIVLWLLFKKKKK